MSDHPPPATRKPPASTKYTLLLDPATRSYQRHLRRNTDINFSDLLRAAVAKIAADPTLEAELFTACGGGYEDAEEFALPVPPEQESPLVAVVAEAEAGPALDGPGSPDGFWSDGDGAES